MKIDLDSLQKASDLTSDWPVGSSCYTEVFYNSETGRVFIREHASSNNWSVFDDPAIIFAGMTLNLAKPNRSSNQPD